MSKILDARGWECPKPVIETRKMLQAEDELSVIVDNRAARENVSRLAAKLGYNVNVEEKDDGTYIHINRVSGTVKKEDIQKEPEMSVECTTGKLVLLIAADTIGRGDDELGGILTRAFMHTFLEVEPKPDVMIFLNSGVKLTVSGSLVLEDLKALASEGVEIMSCGTCLKYFELTDKLAVGEISNAYTIAETLLQAGKIVRL